MSKVKLTIKTRVTHRAIYYKNPLLPARNEYIFNVYLTVGDVIYLLNGSTWNEYGYTAKDAKKSLKTDAEFCNIIDHLLDGVIIKQGAFPAAEIVNYIL